MATDFLQLDPGAAPVRGVTGWLADAVRAAIRDGQLAVGVQLPSTRALAEELHVSRGVVVEAYQRLREEGLLGARTRAGTVVAARPAAAVTPAGSIDPRPRWLSTLRARPDATIDLDLSPGVPDLASFPRAAWLRAERAVLDRAAPTDLGYGDPAGHPRLRAELAGWLGRMRGLRAAPEEILVTAGVAQGLALLAQTLLARGRPYVAVEDPGSPGARAELVHWGLLTVPVPVDEHGLRVDALAATKATAAVVTPAHQYPTGVALGPQRRRDLLAWAGADRLVIEDDYDAEQRYDRTPVAALQAAAPERVAYLGSTSKALAPGLRLGWLIAPTGLRADLVEARYASDLGSPALPQLVLARLLATGDYDRHLRRARARQRRRRDALHDALRRDLPAARVTGIAAGLHLLVTLPPEVDDVDLADRLAGAGVLVHPLSAHRVGSGPPGLVLGYASHPPDRLAEAVRRIAAAVRC